MQMSLQENVSPMNRENDQRIRWMLLLVLGLGTLIRLIFAWRGNLNLDEGQWLYDIHLFQQGALPFIDWTTRAPLLLAISSLFTRLLGYHVFVGRLVSVLAATGTAYMLYRIGLRGASPRVGLAAATLFMLSPFVIYQTIVVHEHPLQELLISASILCLLRSLQKDSNGDAFLHGLLLSLAFLVRRSSPIYFLTEPLLLLVVLKKPLPVLRKLIYVGLGAVLGLTPLIPLVILSDPKWMWIVYGAGGLDVAPPPAEDYSQANVLFNVLFFLTPHYVLLTVSAIRELLSHIANPKGREFVSYALLAMALLFFLLLTRTESWTDHYNTIPTTALEGYLVAGILVIGLACMRPRSSYVAQGLHKPLSTIAWFWLGTTILFYAFVKQTWLLDYSMELVIPLCLLSAMAIFPRQDTFAGRPALRRNVVIVLLLVHTTLTGYILASRPTYARSWSFRHVNAVGDYIAARTEPGEEIFTADTIFAVTAQRPLVLDMSHPALYYMLPSSDPYPYDPLEVVPDMSEIVRYLEEHRVEYIPSGWRTEAMMDTSPRLGSFVQSHYAKETVIDGKTTIYKRLPEDAVLLPSLGHISAPQADHPLYFHFGYNVELLGYSVIKDLSPGNEASLSLYWRALSEETPPLQVECHLLRPDEEPLAKAKWDLPACNEPGRIYRQEVTLPPMTDIDTPTYAQVKLILRRSDNGQQLAAFDKEQDYLEREAIFGRIRVIDPQTDRAPLREPVATFGRLAGLLDYSTPSSLVPGQACQVRLVWQARSYTMIDYSVFIHLLDGEGNIVAQGDSQPRGGSFPTSLWQPGDIVVDSHQLDVPLDIDPQGRYEILVGLYRLDDMTRLPVTDARGQPVANDSLTLRSYTP